MGFYAASLASISRNFSRLEDIQTSPYFRGTIMKAFMTICLLAASLAGCATSKPIQGPSGSQAFYIKCGSAVLDACYEEAAKVCPKGYTMADRQAGPNAALVPAGNALMVVRGPNTMLVECKE